MIAANPKVEKALIGCCLANGVEVVRGAVARGIVEGSFHELTNRDAWRVLVWLLESGGTIDLVGFETAWPKVVANVPHPPVEIWDAVGEGTLPEDLERHVAEVKEWERRRVVRAAGLKLAAAAVDRNGDIEESVAECQGAIRLPPSLSGEEVSGQGAAGLLISELERRQALGGELSGISTGLGRLNELTDGLQAGEFSVIGARPSHGKSALLLGMAAHVALRLGKPVLFVTLEMSVKALLMRLGAMEADVPCGVMRQGKMNSGQYQRMAAFALRLQRAPLWFVSGLRGLTINRLAAVCARHAHENGVALVLVDYLQKLSALEREEKRTYELAHVTGGLKSMAVDLNLHVCAAAQLNRDPDRDKEEGRPPRLTDLADCAQIERDADLICLLHRRPPAIEGTLLVAKQRDGELGSQHLWFDGAHCRFTEETT